MSPCQGTIRAASPTAVLLFFFFPCCFKSIKRCVIRTEWKGSSFNSGLALRTETLFKVRLQIPRTILDKLFTSVMDHLPRAWKRDHDAFTSQFLSGVQLIHSYQQHLLFLRGWYWFGFGPHLWKIEGPHLWTSLRNPYLNSTDIIKQKEGGKEGN